MTYPESGVEAVTFRAQKARFLAVLVSLAAGLIFAGASPAAASTLQVSTTGIDAGDCVGSACLTVQYAVSQSIEGDTISIGSGTFDGAFTIDRKLTIRGTGDGTVLRAATGNLATLAAGSDQTELKDLGFVGDGAASAIRTDAATTGVKITDVEVTGFTGYAVAVHNNGVITDWAIDGLDAHHNQHGMRVRGAAQNLRIANSSFDDNTSHGFFAPVDGGAFDGVVVTDTSFNGNGDKAFYLERGTNISLERVEARDTGGGNHVSPHAIEFNLKQGATAGPVSVIDSTVDGSPGGGIVVRGGAVSPGVTAATITGNVISHSLVGLGFENMVDLSKVRIAGNEFRDNVAGLVNSVEAGTLVLAKDNVFSGNTETDIAGPGTTVILPEVTAPVISGSGTVGEVVTCVPGVGSGYPAPTVTTEILIDGSVVPVSDLAYSPVAADAGKAITCRSTAANIGGSASANSGAVTVTEVPEPPKVAPPKIEAPKKQVTVPNNGKVVAMTIQCPEGTCKINAPKKVKVKIGGKVYYATVKVQDKVGEGKSAKLRLILPKRVRKALKGKRAKASIKVTVVSSDGSKKTVKQTVKLKGKRR